MSFDQVRNINSQYYNDDKFNAEETLSLSVVEALQVPSLPNSSIPVIKFLSAGELAYNVQKSGLMYSDGQNWKDIGDGTVTQVNTGPGLTGGPITVTGTISLSTSGVTAGTYTNPNFTVDSYGRVTSAVSANPTVMTDGVSMNGNGDPANEIILPNRLLAGTISEVGSITCTAQGVITAITPVTAASRYLTNVFNTGTIQLIGNTPTALVFNNTGDPTGLLTPSNVGGQWVLGTGTWTAAVPGWYFIRGSCVVNFPHYGPMSLSIVKFQYANAVVISAGGNFSQGGTGVVINVGPNNETGNLQSVPGSYPICVTGIGYFDQFEVMQLVLNIEDSDLNSYQVSDLRASTYLISGP